MTQEALFKKLKEKKKQSAEYWKDKPRLTKEQLEAVDRYAKEKTQLAYRAFNTPEKITRVEKMFQESLRKVE